MFVQQPEGSQHIIDYCTSATVSARSILRIHQFMIHMLGYQRVLECVVGRCSCNAWLCSDFTAMGVEWVS